MEIADINVKLKPLHSKVGKKKNLSCLFGMDRKSITQGRVRCSLETGAQFEGDLGEILAIGAEISPCIGLREKWESP